MKHAPATPDSMRRDFDRLAALEDPRWDHNALQHGWILARIPRGARSVLEVGCGSGALTDRLAGRARRVDAVDLSTAMIERARERLRLSTGARDRAQVRLFRRDVVAEPLPGDRYDAIVSVATLHHLPLRASLARWSAALAPGGVLLVVDLHRLASAADVLVAAATRPIDVAIRLARTGRPRPTREARAAWREHGRGERYVSLAEIRALARELLPGARVERRPFSRWALAWTKPGGVA